MQHCARRVCAHAPTAIFYANGYSLG
jgi:hypothetical protein